jgi:Ran GTPase-activating protein (RanGAP) involved in mRNA processing and transport
MAFFQATASEVGAHMRSSLIDCLKENDPSLTELAGFGRHTIDEISTALVKNTTVTSFKFNSCELVDEDCTTLMKALTSRYAYQANNLCVTCRPRTKRISLARNQIGFAGAEEIAKFLCSPSINNTSSDKSNVYQSKATCEKCGNTRLLLPRFMEDFIRLELLSNNIGDAGVTAVVNAIASFDSNSNGRSHLIVELGLERNGISDIGMMPICKMLKANTSLNILYLGRNTITHAGVFHLCEALKTNKTLEVLSLTGNSLIGDDGACRIGASLKHNTTLKTLLLKKCGITDRGSQCLHEAIYCDESPNDVTNNSNHNLIEISLCSVYASHYFAQKTLSTRTLLSWNSLGCATAQRLKMGLYLCSDRGIQHVHSLGLDRRLFPALLRRLCRIFRDEYSNKRPSNLDVLWSYLRGMPEVVDRAESKKSSQA